MSPEASAKAVALCVVRAGITSTYPFGFRFISWHDVLFEQGCEVAVATEGLTMGLSVILKHISQYNCECFQQTIEWSEVTKSLRNGHRGIA